MDNKSLSTRSRWTRLALCCLLVLVFIFLVGPLLSRAPLVKTLTGFIDERSIDASALFYTEVEEFADADVYMRNCRDFRPTGPRSSRKSQIPNPKSQRQGRKGD